MEEEKTFFSFSILYATPTIPTKDFEIVRWTLGTLHKITDLQVCNPKHAAGKILFI